MIANSGEEQATCFHTAKSKYPPPTPQIIEQTPIDRKYKVDNPVEYMHGINSLL